MANQRRSRSVVVRDRNDHSPNHFTYSPLDTTLDGIRLVIVEPSISTKDVVRCRLVHVTFGQMPKYEALSYTWGTEEPKNSIFLNDKAFQVRDNLRDALVRLRLPDKERVLWIDAMCINQDDIQERNRQVRIMPHIYNRAQMVLVWLGSAEDYSATQRWETNTSIHFMLRHGSEVPVTRGLLFKEMGGVDYWNRVWIIQEIGKARRIRIHYGSVVIDWETFISTIRDLPWLRDCLPIKLADQMLDKYGDGYKLENLLKTHQKALCKDVRDKIYGFTGLANDNYGRLSMDYEKSLFEIWKDVVTFRAADSTIPQHDILQFAGFVRDLLGGNLISATENMFNKMVQDPEVLGKEEAVLCPARLWGRIAWVGPTYDEIRSNLRKVDEWTAGIRDHVLDSYLRSAYEENDLFLQLLEDIDHSDLDLVSCINPRSWYPASDLGGALSLMNETKPKASDLVADTTYEESDCWSANEDKHLILLDLCPRDDASICNSESSKHFKGIGFAPSNSRAGDFICYFYQKKRAAVVRYRRIWGGFGEPIDCTQFLIIASAVLPDFRAMEREKMNNIDKTKTKEKMRPMFAVLNNSPLRDSETINLYMDLASVYEWSF
jgi:Heterokaryon incompatibility protein (HET)